MKDRRSGATLVAFLMSTALASCNTPRSSDAGPRGCAAAQAFVRTPGEKPGRIGTAGPCLVDAAGNPIVLRGFSIADPEHIAEKRKGVTPVSVMRSAVEVYGATVIRLPIHEGDDGYTGFSVDPDEYMRLFLDPLIGEAARLGIYVILDLHLVSDYLPKKDFAFAAWDKLAPRYGSESHVLFEIFNEPIGPESWDLWRDEVAQPLVDRIREHAPETLVIVGGPRWSLAMAGAKRRPVVGGPIAYTAHFYPESQPERWRHDYETVLESHPVFVTEWGFAPNSVFPLRGTAADFGERYAAWMEHHGVSWAAWIFDNQWAPTILDSEWNLQPDEAGMGALVARLLARP